MPLSFYLNIDLGNAAFHDNSGEISRILKELADKIDGIEPFEKKIYDIDGNNVGKAIIKRE